MKRPPITPADVYLAVVIGCIWAAALVHAFSCEGLC
jgi:hypothetical protein